MASLLKWLGKEASAVGHAVGGAVRGAENVVQHPAQAAGNAVNNIIQHPIHTAENVAQAATRVIAPPVIPAINAANYVIHNPTQLNNNVAKPVGTGLFNVAKGLTVDTPITVGRAANKAINMGGQQRDVNSALAAANSQEDSAWRDYHSGKINGARASALINDASKQRAQATGTFQNQMAQGPSAKDAGMALGMLGLGAAAKPLAAATKAGGALGIGAKVAEGTIGTGFAANTIHQLPQEINQIKQLKGPERTQAITEAAANTGLGVLGGAAAVHGFAPVVKDIAKSPYVNNERGFLAGDGTEHTDANMKIKGKGAKAIQQGQSIPLPNLIKHNELQDKYPALFNKDNGLKVAYNPDPRAPQSVIDHDTGQVLISRIQAPEIKSDAGKGQLVHEIQHAIDDSAGKPSGTTPQFEQYRNAPQEARDAQARVFKSKDQVQQLKSLRNKGNITDAEYNANPIVRQHNSDLQTIKNAPLMSNDAALQSYVNDPGELQARETQARRNMSQAELDATPRQTNNGQATTPQPRQAFSEEPPVEAKSTPQGAKVVENSLTRKGKAGQQNISPELQKKLSGEHEVRNTQVLQDTAVANADQAGLDKTIQDAHDALSVKDGTISDTDVALAHQAIERADQAGRLEDANAIHDALSNHLRAKGQAIQAATLLYQRSPQGMLYTALKTLKKEGVSVTPEIQKELQAHIDAIKSLPDGPAKDFAKAAFGKTLAKHIPQGKLNNLVSVWKAGLLSGVKTQGGNFVSNSVFGILKKLADSPATLADKTMSLITGKRTKTTTLRGGSGIKQGLKTAVTTLKTGIDPRNAVDKYEQHAEINFANKTIQNVIGRPANWVFRAMSAADQPFYYGALKNSLYDQAKADGINRRLRGKALVDYMNKAVANPPIHMVETATTEAQKAVLGYDTIASKAINSVHTAIDNFPASEAGKQTAHAVISFLAPFTKVPSAFITRTIDFTPMGVGKEVFSQVARGKFDQRLLSQAIGEGITGTGILGIGLLLSSQGNLSGDYPKTDPKEAARWKAEGITPNSVKIGGKWVGLNYFGPIGLLFNAADKMHKAAADGAGVGSQAGAAIAGLGQGLMGQSFLQGFSGLSDAINNPTQNAANYVKSEIASVVPNIVNDAANITDPMQRQSNSAFESVKAKIPGARETLNPKQDAFGNDLKQAAGGANAAFNPLKPSNSTSNDLTNEIDRLKGTSKDNFVMPTPDKTIIVGKQTIKLNGNQQYAYNKLTGQQVQTTWDQIVKSPEYAQLSDDDKANALRKAMQDINAVSKVQYLAQIGKNDLSNQAADKLSSTQYKILSGGAMSASDYAVAKSTGGSTRSTDPKSAYKSALDSYNKNKSKMTDVKRISAEKNLRTLSIKKDYSQDVLDFYNLSNTDKNTYFKQNPTKAKDLYGKAQELSQKLSDAGLTSKKVSTSTTKTSGRKSTGRKSTGLKLPNQTNSNKLNSLAKSLRGRTTVSSKGLGLPSYHPKKAATPKIAKIKTRKGSSKLT